MEDSSRNEGFEPTVPTPETKPRKRATPADYNDPNSKENQRIFAQQVKAFGKIALKREQIESRVRPLIGEVNASNLLGASLQERQAFFDGIRDQLKPAELNLLRKSVLFQNVA
ncbi:hypothetical protein [Pseudooceanicola sp. MF1-13]|uniref:hypothetical protein n=1 Tax=Pseudooceanicola sp. MF1-13 TaxID=3379095 RepID=UPI003891B728